MQLFLIIIGTAFATAGVLADFFVSKPQIGGTWEANRFFNDEKDGDFQEIKYLIVNSGVIAVGVICAILQIEIGLMLLFGLGAARLAVAWKNKKKRAENRQKQIVLLRRLRELYEQGGSGEQLLAVTGEKKFYFNPETKVGYYILFRWIKSNMSEEAWARYECAVRLQTLSLKPESEWFKV